MTPQALRSFLLCLGVKPQSSSSKWMNASCPLAPFRHSSGKDSHPSFGVSLTPPHNAKCLACGYVGNLFGLLMEIRDRDKAGVGRDYKTALKIIETDTDTAPLISIPEETKTPTLKVFPESWLTQFERAYTETEVHPYLGSRAVNCTTARRLDIRWDDFRQRICFPVRDFHGRLVGLHGRTVLPDADPVYLVYRYDKQSNPQVWSGEHLIDLDRPVLLVESVFDMARVYPVFPNVLTPRMAAITSKTLERIQGVSRIITMFDNDEAGNFARTAVAQLKNCHITHLSCAPFKDPGECPEDFLAGLLSNYKTNSVLSIA